MGIQVLLSFPFTHLCAKLSWFKKPKNLTYCLIIEVLISHRCLCFLDSQVSVSVSGPEIPKGLTPQCFVPMNWWEVLTKCFSLCISLRFWFKRCVQVIYLVLQKVMMLFWKNKQYCHFLQENAVLQLKTSIQYARPDFKPFSVSGDANVRHQGKCYNQWAVRYLGYTSFCEIRLVSVPTSEVVLFS